MEHTKKIVKARQIKYGIQETLNDKATQTTEIPFQAAVLRGKDNRQ